MIQEDDPFGACSSYEKDPKRNDQGWSICCVIGLGAFLVDECFLQNMKLQLINEIADQIGCHQGGGVTLR